MRKKKTKREWKRKKNSNKVKPEMEWNGKLVYYSFSPFEWENLLLPRSHIISDGRQQEEKEEKNNRKKNKASVGVVNFHPSTTEKKWKKNNISPRRGMYSINKIRKGRM